MNHFNQMANSWDTAEKIKLSELYAQEIKQYLNKQKLKILEVGCGTGLLGSQFVEGDNQLIGVDTSEGMLAVFKNRFKGNSFVQSYLCNLEKEKIQEENFNLILSSMAFHHLVSPFQIVKKLKDLGSNDCRICLIDLDQEDGSFHPDPQAMGVHHFGFSKKEIEFWAKEAGLELLQYKIIHTIEKNNKFYPVFLVILKK